MLVAGGIFSIILYQMAISDTIHMVSENNAMEEQVSSYQNAPEQIKTLKLQLKKIEQLIGSDTIQKMDVHQSLLGSVTEYTQENNLILKDFPQPYTIADKGYITHTAIVTVEGDFIRLLKLSHYLENNFKGGKIVAMDFNITKEIRTRKRKLNSTIYLQHVKPDKNEDNT